MAQEMPDWSELLHDLLVVIARHFNLIEDYLNFRIVCKSWHSAATKNNFNSNLPRVPWLMLPEELEEDDKVSSCRKFFSLYNGMILKKRIPKAARKRCMESMGWLITAGEDEGDFSLLHPFSGVQIQLPHPHTTIDFDDHQTANLITFFQKAVLSASPSHTSDYVLMVTEGACSFLSFWRPGDLLWTRISFELEDHSLHGDVVYFNGQFYAVDYSGRVLACDITGPEPSKINIVAQIPFVFEDYVSELYILQSLGLLFVVTRYGVQLRHIRDDCDRVQLTPLHDFMKDVTCGTINFRVYQVDLVAGKVTQTMELGDRAFFVGANTSLSVQASQFPGIKANHIYFTDSFWETYLGYEEGGGLDMGVFNIADGSIQPHYKGVSLSRVCPPTWVTPTLC